jgi:hypothetical protein
LIYIAYLGPAVEVPLADAMFSLVKVIEDYEGDCLQVQRSSDNTNLDIGWDGNYVDQAAIEAFVGAGTGYVRRWYSQRGGYVIGNDLQDHMPRIVSSGTFLGYVNFGGSMQSDWDYFQGDVDIGDKSAITLVSKFAIPDGFDSIAFEHTLDAGAVGNAMSWGTLGSGGWFAFISGTAAFSDRIRMFWAYDADDEGVRALRADRGASGTDRLAYYFNGVQQTHTSSETAGSSPTGTYVDALSALGARATGPLVGGAGKNFYNLYVYHSALDDSEVAAISTFANTH